MNNLAASREVSTPSSKTADLQSALRRKRRGIRPEEIESQSGWPEFAELSCNTAMPIASCSAPSAGFASPDDEYQNPRMMDGWDHGGGFSVDASVRIEGADRTGLERLLRYCVRPPFALEHRPQRDAEHLLRLIAVERGEGSLELQRN